MSDFYIYNMARERVGLVEHWDSVQWEDDFKKPGEVKIVAKITEDNIQLLQEDNRIHNTDERTVAKIVDVDILDDKESQKIIARGVLTLRIMDERVVMNTETIRNVEQGMYSLYRNNRLGLYINMAPLKGYPDTIADGKEITWGSVLEGLEKTTEVSELGCRVLFDPESTAETFEVYKGVDRSDENSDDYVGFLTISTGDIQKLEIHRGKSNYKNQAIVAGEDPGEGQPRVVEVVSLGNFTDENLRQLYVDARDLQSETSERTYTPTEYKALLRQRGIAKLMERLPDFDITCEIDQKNIVYGKDYFLGDRMPIRIDKYGISASAIVSPVRLAYDKDGRKVFVTLTDFRMED